MIAVIVEIKALEIECYIAASIMGGDILEMSS